MLPLTLRRIVVILVAFSTTLANRSRLGSELKSYPPDISGIVSKAKQMFAALLLAEPVSVSRERQRYRVKRMRSFEEARSFARALNLSSETDWQEWRSSGERPDDIPSNPSKTYKSQGWISYPDWLGYGVKRMRSFEEARRFARALNLSSQKEWREWRKTGERPADIPYEPSRSFKADGWISYPDWLGCGVKRMRSFEEARSFARALKLSSTKEWREWRKTGERPVDIPSDPSQVYKADGWISYPDWLGLEIGPSRMRSFEEARSFARSLNLSSEREWQVWRSSGERPDDIPSNPCRAYKSQGWISYPDWLGYGVKRMRSFEEARSFARALNLSSQKEWREWTKSGQRPDDIPSDPSQVYKADGWISYPDWLGYEIQRMRSFEEARSFARALNLSSAKKWREWIKTGERPVDIPSAPQQLYKLHGWISYPDWLGYETQRTPEFEEARRIAHSLSIARTLSLSSESAERE